MSTSGADVLDRTSNILSIAGWGIVILVGILGVVYFALRIKNEIARAKGPVSMDQTASAIDSALESERKGDYLKAGMNYEALGELEKAAAMFVKGKEFVRAASIYEKLGDHKQAVSMYRRAGESLKAAAVHMRARNYAEAAKIFKNKGDTLRAARALEMMGSKAAAAREYAASGQYIKAARLYKDERMFMEAGEVYALQLEKEPIAPANLGKYYTYAAFLVMAENLALAEQVYNNIASVDPGFKDVQEKVRLIGMRTGKVLVPELELDRVERERREHEALMNSSSPSIDSAPAAEAGVAHPASLEDIHREETAALDIDTPPAPEPSPVAEPVQPEQPSPGPVDEAAYAASLEELSVSDEPPAPQAEQGPAAVAAESVPSTRVGTSVSRDTSSSEIAAKVMGQGDIDDMFDQMGGAGEEASGDGSLSNETTLRSILNSSRMEPRYSMRMWMQILRKLYERHSSGVFYGCILPESIHIDMENNVRLDDPGKKVPEYTAPEVFSGAPADEQADVYVMGVILYEMVTGGIESLGKKHPVDLYDDIPEWMDEMIMRCLEKNRTVRYKGLDEISSLVMQRAASA